MNHIQLLVPHYKPLQKLNVGNCPAATGAPSWTSTWVSCRPGQDGNNKSISISITMSCRLHLPDQREALGWTTVFEELTTNFDIGGELLCQARNQFISIQ
jgi:hypothetical protein